MTTHHRYRWLTDVLPVAGCVTVARALPPGDLARLFGADTDHPVPEDDEHDRDCAAFGAADGGAVAVEPNGWEGTRPEVLIPSSLASGGRVASIYWNENVGVTFSCAEAGEVVASVDLPPYDEDDLDDLPAWLRELLLPHLDSDDVDPVALGAALVEVFTGVGFSAADLDLSRLVRINPLPDVVGSDGVDTTSLAREYPQLAHVIAGWNAVQQRALVRWALRRALTTAGVLDDPDFSAVLDCIGVLAPDPLPDHARARFAAIDRAVDAESLKEREDDWQSAPDELDDPDDLDEPDESVSWSTGVDEHGEPVEIMVVTRSLGPSDREWDEIVARLEAMEEQERGLLDPDGPWPDGFQPDEHVHSESRHRAASLLQCAAETARSAVHPDATTSAWRTVHSAVRTMEAAERVDDGSHREPFLIDLRAQFLPDAPDAVITPKPDPIDAARDLSSRLQRELVEWAATFHAEAAGVSGDPDFAAVLSQLGSGRCPVLPPATVARFARIHDDLQAAYQRRVEGPRESTASFDVAAMLAEVAEVVERTCEEDVARAAAFVVGSAEMTLATIALATGNQREDAFWRTLEERFGIAR